MVAQLLMDVWADILSRILEDNDVILYMLAKYVDDIILVLSIMQKGFSLEKDREGGSWKLLWTEERERLDLERGE